MNNQLVSYMFTEENKTFTFRGTLLLFQLSIKGKTQRNPINDLNVYTAVHTSGLAVVKNPQNNLASTGENIVF